MKRLEEEGISVENIYNKERSNCFEMSSLAATIAVVYFILKLSRSREQDTATSGERIRGDQELLDPN